jgi:serine/threonine-protein kinase
MMVRLNRESLLQIVESRSMIDGRFANVRRLGIDGGAGMFSLIFTAQDLRQNSVVALKFFNPEFEGNAYRRLAFRREAELLENLAGKADIVRLITPISGFTEVLTSPTGVEIGIPFNFYALELARSSLGQVVAYKTWTPVQRLEAFRAACRGVQRLHSLAIVHRDLKPSNFLVFDRRMVKLADFGTARSLDPGAPRLRGSYAEFPPGDLGYTAP